MYHPDWLTNPVLVPKNNKDWRMCVDYTDLNKACKKDPVAAFYNFSTATLGTIRFPVR
jgi:hypothetical protein